MRNETAKVPANDAVPCCALAVVELTWSQDRFVERMMSVYLPPS